MRLPEHRLAFTADGILPPGDHVLTISSLPTSCLVLPDSPSVPWNGVWRAELAARARHAILALWTAGAGDVVLDGSFVEDTPEPRDVDGFFECDECLLADGTLEARLNQIDPAGHWTWDARRRRRGPGSSKAELPMWHARRLDFYPLPMHQGAPEPAVRAILDELFRRRRSDGRPKGVVRLVRPAIRGPT